MWSRRLFCVSVSLIALGFLSPTLADSIPSNINMQELKTTRMDRHNQERARVGLPLYTGNALLDASAQNWAEYLKSLGTTTHRRTKKDGYYNYRSVKDRFGDQWVQFTWSAGNLLSESLGWGLFSCKQADCTPALLKAIKKTFAYFMAERYSSWRPHYNGIVMKEFMNIGFGLAINKNKYYLVTHYGQEVLGSWSQLDLGNMLAKN